VRVTKDPGYLIEDRPEGRTLVVTGRWTSEAEAAVQRTDVDGVWLNYARGFCEPGLSFVGDWPIRRLLVLDRSITDLEPLARLAQTLEDLSFQVAPGTPLDLTMLPRLRNLAGPWEEIRESIYAPEYLQRLVIFDYDEVDLEPLAVQPSLQEIDLKVARHLETLRGSAEFLTLRSLKIADARALDDLDGIAAADATLRKLNFESCRAIDDLDALSTLSELRWLGISDCGGIPSIKATGALIVLETLYAWGTTRVEDGDLSPLLRLSRLKEIRMRDRHEYRPRLAEIEAHLGCA
jgi:hypothetical protein